MPYKAHQEKEIIELGLESLKSRRWFWRLCCMFKIMKNQAPEYQNNLISKFKQNFNSRNIYISSYNSRTEYFKSSFFPAFGAFKQNLLPFIRPLENSIFIIFEPEGLKLLTRLRLGFSRLNEHCFQHNFQECLNPLCMCSLGLETKMPLTTYCTAIITLPFVLVLRIV